MIFSTRIIHEQSIFVIDFFENNGVELKTERGNRVFPVSDNANDVAGTLSRLCERYGVKILHTKASRIYTESGAVCGVETGQGRINCRAAAVCTGGLSYPLTGSDGDGYRFAREAGHEVTAVVTQPDKPKGRGHEMQFTPVKEVALKHNLTVLQPKKIRDPEVVAQLETIPADICVVVAFGQIIPKSILEMKKYGCINVHASLLPAYRGAAPIQWAVVDGLEETGVTIMQMDEGLDTGDMLTKVVVPLDKDETGGSLFDKLSVAGAKLCVETMELIEKGEVTPEKQGETTTEYAKMITKDLGKIDFSKSAVEIERLIRGFNPWPSAYTKLGNKTLKIWAADVLEEEYEGAFGEIIKVSKNEIFVKCKKGTLSLKEIQLEGKKRMTVDAFLRGYQLESGVLLG